MLTEPTVNQKVKSWCRTINLKGNFGSHSLRKTWGYHQRVTATSQLGCPWPQFNRPWKSHNNRQRKMPPEAGFAIGGVIGVIY